MQCSLQKLRGPPFAVEPLWKIPIGEVTFRRWVCSLTRQRPRRGGDAIVAKSRGCGARFFVLRFKLSETRCRRLEMEGTRRVEEMDGLMTEGVEWRGWTEA